VVHIAYEDATAYAAWAGKRLPTEAEWELAARGGLQAKRFVWGDAFGTFGRRMANTHLGECSDLGADGYAPVAHCPPNGYGLYDIEGTVWQWTSDWYRPDYYPRLAAAGDVARNPKGPNSSYDPLEPSQRKKVQRGGWFLYTDQYFPCSTIRTRGKGEVGTGTNRLGFRCVKPRAAASERAG
jgi:formylglycine-generating enzyme required for sulfatase activity